MTRLAERLGAAARALRRARRYAAAVAAAVTLSGGVALPVLLIRHRAGYVTPPMGDDAVRRLLSGRWPAGWGMVLETPAQHAGVLAARDLLVCFAALGLGMACATVGALALSRAAARRRDVAVRAALGATPVRVAGDIALEVGLLAAAALTLLAALAAGATAWLTISRPALLRDWIELAPAALALLAVAPLLTLFLFAPLAGLPAASRRLARALGSEATATPGPEAGLLRHIMAVLQLTTAISLLVGAGLLLRTRPDGGGTPGAGNSSPAAEAARATPGTVAGRMPAAAIAPVPAVGAPPVGPAPVGPREGARLWEVRATEPTEEPGQRAARYAELQRLVASLPGVRAAGLASPGAWLGQGAQADLQFTCPRCVIGPIGVPVMTAAVRHDLVGPGFFAALGVRPSHGRDLSDGDGSGALRVAVINRSFEVLFQGTTDPVGQSVRIRATGRWYRIVGVVPDVRAPGLGASLGAQAAVYLPLEQHPPRAAELVVRTGGFAAANGAAGAAGPAPGADSPRGTDAGDGGLDAAVARALAATGVAAEAMGPLAAQRARLAAPLRWFGRAGLALAVVVLLLAIHGVAAVAADDVRRRRRELAIRGALGATPGRLVTGVLARGLWRVLLGAGWAVGGACLVAWLLQRMSPELARLDAGVFLVVLGVVATAALGATGLAAAAVREIRVRESLEGAP